MVQIARAAIREFRRDQCGLRAAALSYSTVFALPPLLILLIKVAGLMWSPGSVQGALESEFAALVGAEGAHAVQVMVSSGERSGHGALGTALGIAGLLLGATGAFLSLQDALNWVWEVKPDPRSGGIKGFFVKRLLSLGMFLVLAFLLAVSLAVTAIVGALGSTLGTAGEVMQVANLLTSLAILSVLFAAIYKLLPDAVIGWRSVWVGGTVTAVLFELGKLVIGLYLGRSNPGNPFGAASALAVILVWIYYASMLILLGAEFTQQYAEARGHGILPRKGAVRFVHRAPVVVPRGEAAD